MSNQDLPEVLACLSRAVANLSAPQRTWWTITDIADELQLHEATVRTKIVCRSDFPKACPLTDTARGELRWRRADVMDWVEGRQLPQGRSKRVRKPAAAA